MKDSGPEKDICYQQDDEISLLELFSILRKHYKIIILTTILFVVLAGLYVFIAEPLYKITAQVKVAPPHLTPQDLNKWFVEGGCSKVFREYSTSDIPLRSYTPRRGTTILVELLYPDPNKGEQLLGHCLQYCQEVFNKSKHLVAERQKKAKDIETLKEKIKEIDLQKRELERKIQQVKKQILLKEKEKSLIKANLKAIEKAILDIKNIIKNIDKNTESLLNLRTKLIDNFLDKKTTTNLQITMLLYSNIVQQNISYISTLELRILDLNKQKTNLLKKINLVELEQEKLKNEINKLTEEKDIALEQEKKILSFKIDKLKADLERLVAVEVLQQPISSNHPVKPKKMLILALAMVVGLFVGIFFCFIYELFRASKE